MDKIRDSVIDQIKKRHGNIYRSDKTLADEIHQKYLEWLRFHLPDARAMWSIKECLDELERIFIEE